MQAGCRTIEANVRSYRRLLLQYLIQTLQIRALVEKAALFDNIQKIGLEDCHVLT